MKLIKSLIVSLSTILMLCPSCNIGKSTGVVSNQEVVKDSKGSVVPGELDFYFYRQKDIDEIKNKNDDYKNSSDGQIIRLIGKRFYMKWKNFPFDNLKDKGFSEEQIEEFKVQEACLGWADLSSYVSPSFESNEDDKYFIKYTQKYNNNNLINDAKFALIFAPAVFKSKCDFDTNIFYTRTWDVGPDVDDKKNKSSNAKNYKIDSNTILLGTFDEMNSNESFYNFSVLKSGSKIIVDLK